MRIALVADLHGNMTAVYALEKDLRRQSPDEVWCLGDLVGKGPRSDLTFDWAVSNCQVILGGNWDYGIGRKEYPRDGFYHDQLGSERMKRLSELPREQHLQMSGRKIRLIHGRPVMDRLMNIQDSREAFLALLEPDYAMLVYADCHRQGARTLTGQIINIGSVGNALGIPMVQYAILEGEPGTNPAPLEVRFITLPYDKQMAAKEAAAQPGLPHADAYVHEVLTGVYAGEIRKNLNAPS